MNYLNAVFWDYPQFTDERALKTCLNEKAGSTLCHWIMTRFLEHGRVVDTLAYFKLEEIAQSLPRLRLSPYTEKKWKRILQVYGNR